MLKGPRIDCLNESSLPFFHDRFLKGKEENFLSLQSSFPLKEILDKKVSFFPPEKNDLSETKPHKVVDDIHLPLKNSIYFQLNKTKLVKKVEFSSANSRKCISKLSATL